jgi:hypothetical protein
MITIKTIKNLLNEYINIIFNEKVKKEKKRIKFKYFHTRTYSDLLKKKKYQPKK